MGLANRPNTRGAPHQSGASNRLRRARGEEFRSCEEKAAGPRKDEEDGATAPAVYGASRRNSENESKSALYLCSLDTHGLQPNSEAATRPTENAARNAQDLCLVM